MVPLHFVFSFCAFHRLTYVCKKSDFACNSEVILQTYAMFVREA